MTKPLPRVIVSGQLPPPVGGQNVMIRQLLESLQTCRTIRTTHLPFYFTPRSDSARKSGLGKILEFIRVIGRLVKIRLQGPIDLLVFPSGGPQAVPLLRDLLLLPWILAMSRRTILHFHAAGIAESVAQGGLLANIVKRLYARCDCAIVMTEFNRRDPDACGIQKTVVIPHRLRDDYEEKFIDREGPEIRLLAMGHLCPDKGIPLLIKAFARVAADHPELYLELAGEVLSPYTEERLLMDLKNAGIQHRVRLLGVLSGAEKKRVFGRAHLLIFPSVAPYESFGLVMVEAMMWRLPLIASDWRGNADVVRGAGGCELFSPAESEGALERAIRRFLDLRPNWTEWGDANRRTFISKYRRNGSDPITEFLAESAIRQ